MSKSTEFSSTVFSVMSEFLVQLIEMFPVNVFSMIFGQSVKL